MGFLLTNEGQIGPDVDGIGEKSLLIELVSEISMLLLLVEVPGLWSRVLLPLDMRLLRLLVGRTVCSLLLELLSLTGVINLRCLLTGPGDELGKDGDVAGEPGDELGKDGDGAGVTCRGGLGGGLPVAVASESKYVCR